jgi:transcriptional repressor NF-X1
MFRVKASCKCGQNTIEIPCNASSKSSGSKTLLECNDFCAKVHRNRRLALALDIKRDDFGTPSLSLDDLGYYDDSLREFFNENASWCRHMEATLIEFAKDPFKKTSHLRPMKSEYRRFIHRYAVHFNIATEAIDAEPKRSVILRKTLGACRIPTVLLSKAARNPNLNRPPPVLEAAINGEIRAPKNPVNALYLSDMAFGLTKLELDAELVPIMKLGDDTIPFNSTWVNENDAVVVPIINDAVSMDEKELIVWQLKKTLKAAFASEDVTKQKASRVDCCWVNQKGEITWNEKQLLKSNNTNTTSLENGKSSSPKNSNSFAALSNMDDDGWMRVGDDNPYRAVKDAWKEEIQKPTTPRTADSDASSSSILEEISDTSSTEKPEMVNVNGSKSSESDDWELLTEENNL